MLSCIEPMSRTAIINRLISDNHLNNYLEIGVSNPYVNYLDVRCTRKVSVDPCVECEFFSAASIKNFRQFITHIMTSDEFFAKNRETFDIIFIDGDHSYAQSLADLNNALRTVRRGGFIVLHDAMPDNYAATQIENFQQHQPYSGEVWKTVVSAIAAGGENLQIGTFPYDYGVCVIKKLTDADITIPALDLEWKKDYAIEKLNPVYEVRDFADARVSYFTPLYNTPARTIERTARTVLNQTNPHWEWVLVDDSNNAADAARLEKFLMSLNDPRIRYYRMNTTSGGRIGWIKKRAANLCTGEYLAELDHDDLLMPDLTENILRYGDGYDFIATNCASVVVNDDESLTTGEIYPDGFAMGYGSYRIRKNAINPLTGWRTDYNESIVCPINPKTIRHIVGVPNHVRVWSRAFYDAIGGHNEDMRVVDDYELVVRTFLNGGRMLHLDCLGYLQTCTGDNTTDKRREEIQLLVRSVMSKYDTAIAEEFARRGMEDWAYEYYRKNINMDEPYHYWDVPTRLGAPRADDCIVPESARE